MHADEFARRRSNTEKVAEYFQSRPGVWVSTRELELVGGRNAWRTRVSDFRKIVLPRGGNVINRQRRERGGMVISEYCYQAPGRLF